MLITTVRPSTLPTSLFNSSTLTAEDESADQTVKDRPAPPNPTPTPAPKNPSTNGKKGGTEGAADSDSVGALPIVVPALPLVAKG